MLTIDEAIAHAKEVASRKFDDRVHCIRCAEEHEQLVEWLEELKANKVTSAEIYEQGYNRGYNDAYNKAINDLMQKCDKFSGFHRDDVSITIRDMSKIAEQLKKKR
ncbi:MAG: hypothetical protein SPK43_02245 [Candidatus Onthovivens sp.]|nr:hypothetical protein [Candidatus Onthovivens sp.]